MIRVFPRRTKWTPTDDLAFVGDPPLFLPPQQKVQISVCFTWDIQEGMRLMFAWRNYYSDVEIGGPAYDDPGGEFIPGRFIRNGVTITSRGCNKKCTWCYVPKREGCIRELPIADGYILQDNNLLACSKPHLEKVFTMLRRQPQAIKFSGGIDASLLNEWHRVLFDTIRLNELWLACDTPQGEHQIERASKILDGIPPHKRRCYVMVGFGGETIYDAEKRLERVYALGFYPFCQLYRGPGEQSYDHQWLTLRRKWSRPAIYKHSNPRLAGRTPDELWKIKEVP